MVGLEGWISKPLSLVQNISSIINSPPNGSCAIFLNFHCKATKCLHWEASLKINKLGLLFFLSHIYFGEIATCCTFCADFNDCIRFNAQSISSHSCILKMRGTILTWVFMIVATVLSKSGCP